MVCVGQPYTYIFLSCFISALSVSYVLCNVSFTCLTFPVTRLIVFFSRFDSSAHIVFYVLDSYAHICILCTPCSLHIFFLSLIFSPLFYPSGFYLGSPSAREKLRKKVLKKTAKRYRSCGERRKEKAIAKQKLHPPKKQQQQEQQKLHN